MNTEQQKTTETPKKLTREEAVKAACILFELNTKENDILEFAEKAGITFEKESTRTKECVLNEWYGFVHAAIVYALSTKVSNDVMLDYLRCTHDLLQKVGKYDDVAVEAFVDDTFAGYLTLLIQEKQKECPNLFFQKVLGVKDITTLPSERVAFLAGMMAITICALLDKMEEYEYTEEQ